ncbi:MAG: hypothetical protein U5K71_08940 [Gracilimonas sp.]|nr:hypothetical protein [Gracilimonas sp.]
MPSSQVTDRSTEIDATGTVLNQGDKFKAGLYLTIRYTPEIMPVLREELRMDIHTRSGYGRIFWMLTSLPRKTVRNE